MNRTIKLFTFIFGIAILIGFYIWIQEITKSNPGIWNRIFHKEIVQETDKVTEPEVVIKKVYINDLKLKITPKLLKWCYTNSSIKMSTRMIKEIIEECSKYDIGILLLANALAETSLRPWQDNFPKYSYIISKIVRGEKLNKKETKKYRLLAIGLMQIKPYYWLKHFKKLNIVTNIRDFYDYKYSIKMAYEILKYYYSKTHDWERALRMYTASRKNTKKVLALYGYLVLNKI